MMKMKGWLNNLEKNVKKRRDKLKWSQQKLATEAKVALTTIARIEQGIVENPTLDTIDSLGFAFKMDDPLELLKKS